MLGWEVVLHLLHTQRKALTRYFEERPHVWRHVLGAVAAFSIKELAAAVLGSPFRRSMEQQLGGGFGSSQQQLGVPLLPAAFLVQQDTCFRLASMLLRPRAAAAEGGVAATPMGTHLLPLISDEAQQHAAALLCAMVAPEQVRVGARARTAARCSSGSRPPPT